MSTSGGPGQLPIVDRNDRPVFIGACPRSGTTLLRTMLSSHPELAIPRESRFLLDAWDRRAEFGDLSREENRRRFARWVFHTRSTRPGRFEIDRDEAVERLAAAPSTLGSLVGMPFQLYAERHGKPRWGDKRPHYAQRIPALFTMFPDAQFVHVVRDPRGSVASIRKLGWFDGDLGAAAELWGRALRAVDAQRDRLAPDQFMEIRYEDLVSDPQATLGQLASFLGLADGHVGDMLAYYSGSDVPESRYHWRVSQPLTAAAVRGWEGQLSDAEVAFVEQVHGKAMRRYGYTLATPGARPSRELLSSFARRRIGTTLSRGKRAAREAKVRRTYRYPVAARLTSGQQQPPC